VKLQPVDAKLPTIKKIANWLNGSYICRIRKPLKLLGMSNNTLTLQGGKTKVENLALKKSVIIMRALNHKIRQQMLKMIDENKTATVTAIHTKLKIEQSVASQHLAYLRRAGIVINKRDGKFITYSINYDNVKHYAAQVVELSR
jgi:ArsR family transcriptional regulator, virulence genes transcriptional regulator